MGKRRDGNCSLKTNEMGATNLCSSLLPHPTQLLVGFGLTKGDARTDETEEMLTGRRQEGRAKEGEVMT